MSEVAGLAVGVVALAGLFADAVKCFQYVELGKSFDGDYTTSVLRLQMLGVQLSHWGEAVGLSTIDNDPSRLTTGISDGKKQLIQETLRQICSSLDKAEADSRKIAGLEEGKSKELKDTGLVDKLKSLSLERIPKSRGNSLSGKTKWVLHRRETFNNLVEGLERLIHELIETFPPSLGEKMAGAYQRDMAEVTKVNPEYVKLMEEWADKYSKRLEAVNSKSSDAEALASVVYKNTFGDRNNVAQTGHVSGSNNVSFGS